MKNIKFLSLVLLIALSSLVRAHGPIPIPLEGVIKTIDRQLPSKISSIKIDNSNFPSIATDLDSLNNKDKKISFPAYKRLITRGDKSTPEIVKRIQDADTSLLEKKHLINLLGRLKTPGADKIIINFTEKLRKLDKKTRRLSLQTLYYQTFRTLSNFDDKTEVIAYANTLLDNKKIEPAIHAQALEFLANEEVKSATAWIDIYKDNDNIDIQYAALYLGGKLSIESAIDETITFLKNKPKSKKSYKREVHLLLSNLVHFVKPEDLHELIKVIKKNDARFLADKKFKTYPILSMLYTGNNEQRTKAAQASLALWSSNKKAIIASLEHMIKINDATPYITPWKLHHPVLRRYLHHLGYAIKTNKNDAKFIKTDNDKIIKEPDTESVSKLLVNSFIGNDIDLFESSILINKNILNLIKQNRNDPNKNMDAIYKSLIANTISKWKSIYKKGETIGLNWRNVKYISSKGNILVNIDGSLMSSITITIKEKNNQHTLFLEQCILFDNHWYSLGSMKFI